MAKRKDYIVVIIVIALIAILLLAIGDPTRNFHKTINSSYSASDSGAKGFYLSLREYGKETNLFKTEIYNKYGRYIGEDTINVIINPNYDLILNDLEVKAIRNKIDKGTNFVLFIDQEEIGFLEELIEGYLVKDKETYREYIGEKGRLITYFISDLNNLSLKTDRIVGAQAIVFLGELAKESGRRLIQVNDYYHTGKSDAKLVDTIGFGPLLFLIQIAISIILWAIYKGVRFGSPEIAYETIKRDELENVHALKNLYKKSNSPRIVFDVHMEALIGDLRRKHNIVTYDNEETYKYLDKDLLKIYESKKQIGKGQVKRLIEKIEKTRKEL